MYYLIFCQIRYNYYMIIKMFNENANLSYKVSIIVASKIYCVLHSFYNLLHQKDNGVFCIVDAF